jgi:hypothetical protein
VILSLWYRKEGPQQPVYEWMNEDEEEKGREGEEGNGRTDEIL